MGFRTVVMLSNDMCHAWSKDQELGQKIHYAMSFAGRNNPYNRNDRIGNYGRVVECTHADTQTLAVLTHYENFVPLTHNGWTKHEEDDAISLRLLKEAADKLGYRLVKKNKGEMR